MSDLWKALDETIRSTFGMEPSDRPVPESAKTSTLTAKQYKEAPMEFYQSDDKGKYTLPNKMNMSQVDAIAYGANLLSSQGVANDVVDKYVAIMFREQEQSMGVDSGTRVGKKIIKNAHGTGHQRFREAIEMNYGINPRSVTKETNLGVKDGNASKGGFINVEPTEKEGAKVTGYPAVNKIGAQKNDFSPYDPNMIPEDYLRNAKLSSTMFSDLISDSGKKVNIQNWNPGFKDFDKAIGKTEQDLMNEQNTTVRDYITSKLNYDSKFKGSTANSLESKINPTNAERNIINYHRNTIKTGKVGSDEQGRPVTVYSTGIIIPEGPNKGKFVAVPGYVNGKIETNEDKLYAIWKKDIQSGKWPIYNSGKELNADSKEIHQIMDDEETQAIMARNSGNKSKK